MALKKYILRKPTFWKSQLYDRTKVGQVFEFDSSEKVPEYFEPVVEKKTATKETPDKDAGKE